MIGYHDRFKGCMEVELTKYACGGDIPWHRVLYFRHGDFLWHKETRLDLVFNSTDQAAANLPDREALRLANRQEAELNRAQAEEAARLRVSVPRRSRVRRAIFHDLERVPVHSSSRLTGKWVALDRCGSGNLDIPSPSVGNEISICTLNVLSDFYLPEHLKCFTQQRWERVADIIAVNPSHIWVFTEATQDFASFLLSCDTVQHLYRSSIAASNMYKGIPAHPSATGQLVLLRRDIACDSVWITKSSHPTGKLLTFVACTLSCGTTLGLCAVHLTSGQREDANSSLAREKRTAQLAEALKHVEMLSVNEKPCMLQVVAGDFNFKSSVDDLANANLLQDFVEAGVPLQRNTYAPSENSLAQLNGKGSDMRLDRIYMKARESVEGDCVIPTVVSHSLLATEPFRTLVTSDSVESQTPMQLMASDHFGVSTSFLATSGLNLVRHNPTGENTWTYTTALALLPEEDFRNFLDEWIRKDHDSACKKWPPHCNLLFPFVIPELIPATLSDLSDSLAVQNFSSEALGISFAGISSFRNKATSNVHLRCTEASGTKIRELQTLANQSAEKIAGPKILRKGGSETEVYNPHVTLAKIRTNCEPDRTLFLERAQLKFEQVEPERWKCQRHTLVALQKCGDCMTVIAEQPLPCALKQASLTKQTLILLRSICKLIFKGSSTFELYPVGSSALLKGIGAIADVDVVVSPPENMKHMTPSEFADEVAKVMAASGNHRVRISAGDATTISIDLQESHGLLPIDIMFGDSKYSLQARDDSYQQCQLLETLIADRRLTRDIFTDALSQVKRWAHSRMLTQRAFGLWSGIAWSVMTLAVCRTRQHASPHDLLVNFFDFYAAVNWDLDAVSVNGLVTRDNLTFLDGRDCRNDGAIVLSPGTCTERSNVVRGVSRAVTLCLRGEIVLAQTFLKQRNTECWKHHMQTTAPQVRERYTSCVVVRLALAKTANMTIDLANIEGWLKGRFALFSKSELGERGIAVRPAAKLDVETVGTQVTAELVCGIEESLSKSEFFERKALVRHAELQLRDRFLRWDDRPSSATIEVRLEEPSN